MKAEPSCATSCEFLSSREGSDNWSRYVTFRVAGVFLRLREELLGKQRML